MQIIRVVVSLILIVLVHCWFDWYNNQPKDVGSDVPSGKLRSLSFAPYREGYSPLEKIYPLPEHIEEDLQILADKTETIRTYSSLAGMQPTPDLARKYGIKMIQGGWLGNGHKENRLEVEALIKSANENADVVQRVIIGNEVLLRGDLDIDHLIGYIREVKRSVKQPVSYADVWSMYMKYPQLIKEVDFITIHILPYWEDEPISVQNASDHLEKVVKQVEDEARGIAPGKPILIGESGWPSAGRQRGLAIPNVVNEAKFIRDLIEVANRHNFDYNIVEAFNQPWKSNLEGVVGANWGLISVDRKPVFSLTGLVSENPQWLLGFVEASLLLGLIVAAFFKKLQSLPLTRLMLFLILAQIISICLVTLANYLWFTSYSPWQRAYTVAMVSANALLAGLIVLRCSNVLHDSAEEFKLARWLRSIYILFILLALYKTYGLGINGRYLSFPLEQFSIPVIGICGLIICLGLTRRNLNGRIFAFDQLVGWSLHTQRDRLIAYLLTFAIFAMVAGETKAFLDGRDFIHAHPGISEGLPVALSYTLNNQQLQLWLVYLFFLSVPFWTNTGNKNQTG